MKHIILTFLAAIGTFSLNAESLNVNFGNISYNFPASEAGEMTYSNAESLTINGNVFNLSEVTSLKVVDEELDENTVNIIWEDNDAYVVIAGNLTQYVTAKINGGHVTIDQSKEVSADTCGEITYILSGSSDNGSLLMNGSYKSTIQLTGLSLNNPDGAAIDIQNGKRIDFKVAEKTENFLSDGFDGDQKGCLVSKGHLEFKQKGTLNIIGNNSHAIYSKEYVTIKNTTLNILGAKKDGINCTQYFAMESGNLTIIGIDEDGIQVEYKDSTDREDEDTGEINIAGGTLNIIVTADACKALKAEGDITIEDGELIALVSGNGTWDSSKSKTKASACIASDQQIIIDGGILSLTATGSAGKGITCDGDFTVNEGDITIVTTGGVTAYVNGSLQQNYTGNTERLDSDMKSSPKGIKANGDIFINNGFLDITTAGKGGEGIESKATLTIAGGIIKVRSYDDATNSSDDTIIEGGDLDLMSIGDGDGIDSNGNIRIKGGRISVFGAARPEEGFDAGDGYKIFFTGGEILAYGGGGNSVPSSSESTQAYITVNQNFSAGDEVTVEDNGETILSFVIPSDYTSSGGNGGGPGMPKNAPLFAPVGGGGFGNTENGLLLSCPAMVSGNSYTVKIGSSSYSATAGN